MKRAKRLVATLAAAALMPVYLLVFGAIGLIDGTAAFLEDMRRVADRWS